MRWLDGIIDSMGVNVSKLREMVKDKGWHLVAAVHGGHKELNNNNKTNCFKKKQQKTWYPASKPKVLGRVAGSGNSDWVAQRLLFQPLRGILALTSELIIF